MQSNCSSHSLPTQLFLSTDNDGLKFMSTYTLRVNGAAHQVKADPSTPLIFVLRNQLGLTGPKLGCGLEQCGACAVLVDGKPELSCVRAVSEFEDQDITTAEGLTESHADIQQAFIDAGAAQCGYCIPGIVTATAGLFNQTKTPTKAQITEALHGHLCRCGSHLRVLKAIDRLVQEGVADAN
jgi:aerobic-type carbon monoxide dehydrogenase small subunit (CoxS/CutS family)